jgi:hypothetical protein
VNEFELTDSQVQWYCGAIRTVSSVCLSFGIYRGYSLKFKIAVMMLAQGISETSVGFH